MISYDTWGKRSGNYNIYHCYKSGIDLKLQKK